MRPRLATRASSASGSSPLRAAPVWSAQPQSLSRHRTDPRPGGDMIDAALQRKNMVESRVRPSE